MRSRTATTRSAGSQAAAVRRHGSAAVLIERAACFSSGCSEVGQCAFVVSALMPARRDAVGRAAGDELVAPVHRDVGLRAADAVVADQRQHDRAAPRAHLDQVAGLRSRPRACRRVDAHAGLPSWPNRRATVPLRLMPCHWSRRRPVFSAERAWRGSVGSAGGAVRDRDEAARGRRGSRKRPSV
jgi:hypothetical protein